MLRALAMALPLFAACGGGETFVLASEGLGSVMLFEIGRGDPSAILYDTSTERAVRRDVPASSRFVALEYVQAPAALGLSPGPVPLASEGVPLPVPKAIHWLEDDGWAAVEALPPELASARLPYGSECASFVLAPAAPFPSAAARDAPTFAVALDEERAFVGTASSGFFVLGAGRSERRTELAPTLPHRAGAIHRGEIWLAGPGDAVAHGHPDRGFVSGPPLPFEGDRLLMLAAPPDDEDFELFAIDGSLRVAHFDGARWRVVREARRPPNIKSRPRIAWIGPGEAASVGAGSSTISEIDRAGHERVVAIDLSPRVLIDSPWEVSYVEGVGPVLGTRYLIMYRRDAPDWVKLELTGPTPRADVIASIGGGAFVALGQDGVIAQWGPGALVCLPTALPFREIWAAVPRAGGTLFLGKDSTGFVSLEAARAR